MTNTNEFIKEYLELTGRPVATLSVAEFLEFKSFFGVQKNTNFPVESSEKSEPTEVENVASIKPLNNNTDFNSNASSSIKKSVSKPSKSSNHSENTSILSLLQSVSG